MRTESRRTDGAREDGAAASPSAARRRGQGGVRRRAHRPARRPARGAALLAALLAAPLVACGGASPEPELAPPTEATRGAETAERDTLQDAERAERARLEALYRARVDSARLRFTEADVRFTTDMIVHHAQALLMARLAPTHGASPAVQRLAARVHAAQVDEIALMQRWLRDRGQPVPEVTIEGTTLTVEGIDVHAPDGAAGVHAGHSTRDRHGPQVPDMPGMLSPEELRELDRARGEEFDRLFLTYMVRHHRGAVTMVRELVDTPGAAQEQEMFRLASEIQAEQLTEIARMERMLEEMFGPT